MAAPDLEETLCTWEFPAAICGDRPVMKLSAHELARLLATPDMLRLIEEAARNAGVTPATDALEAEVRGLLDILDADGPAAIDFSVVAANLRRVLPVAAED